VLRAFLIRFLTLLSDWSSLNGALLRLVVADWRRAIWRRLRLSQALPWPGAISAAYSMRKARYGWPFTTLKR